MINVLIGGGLALIALLALFIFWIIAIVKAFKGGSIVWGVLTFVLAVLGPIFFFVKGHIALGVWNIIFFLIFLVGSGFCGYTLSNDDELMKQIQEMVPVEVVPDPA